MGVKEIKSAFEQAIGPDYSCHMAIMDYDRSNGVESQVLLFRGNDQSGAPFEIKSDPIGPGGDLIQGAKDTAMRLIGRENPPTE